MHANQKTPPEQKQTPKMQKEVKLRRRAGSLCPPSASLTTAQGGHRPAGGSGSEERSGAVRPPGRTSRRSSRGQSAGRSHSHARAPARPSPPAHSPTGKKCEKQDRSLWPREAGTAYERMSAGSEIPLQLRGEMNLAPSGLSRLGRPSIPLARCLDTDNKGLYSTQRVAI